MASAAYFDIYDQGCAVNAPWAVVITGVAGGARQFKNALSYLMPDFRVMLFTTPGVGETPALPGVLTVTELAKIVQEQLTKHRGDKLLIGHSMGGFVAQQVAAETPELVKKLVLLGSSYGRPATQQDMLRLSRHFGQDLLKLATIQQGKSQPDAAHDIRFSEEFRKNQRVEVEAFQQLYADTPLSQATLAQHMTCGAQFSSKNWAHKIKQPTFLIHGGEDWIVSPASGLALAQELLHSQWLKLEGVGHFPFIERPEMWQRLHDFWRGATVGVRP